MPRANISTNDDGTVLVECQVCGDSKETRSMPGHVGSGHGLTIDQYVDKYGPETGKHFYFSGAPKGAVKKIATIEDEIVSTLSTTEKKFYDEYSAEIFGQIDRDMAQLPVVMSLTVDMITLIRLRKQMDALHPAKVKPDAKLPDSKTIDALVRSLKYTEERIRAQMKSLGIAREDKLKNRAQIKSTPFALIAGYMDELERMTPQQAMSLENEERKLYAIVKERINKFYVSLAPDIVAEEEDDDGSLSSLDVERIVADLDIEM